MGGGGAIAAAETVGKLIIFAVLAFPLAVMVAGVGILSAVALVDRQLRAARRIVAIAGFATASAVGPLVSFVGVVYRLSLPSGSAPDWAMPAAMVAIWLSLVCWQLALVGGIFYGRDASTLDRPA